MEFAPIAGATGQRFSMGISDTSGMTEIGRFVSFSPVPPGVYDVTFRAHGWRPARVSGLRVPRDGPVPVLRVDRGAGVEGRVLSLDGKPLAAVSVIIGPERGAQLATTGADGTFALTGLEPGEQPATAQGRFVVQDARTVRAPAVGPERIEWRLATGGALEVDLADPSREGAVEKIVVTPLTGGKPLEQENDGTLRWGRNRHGAHFDGVAPGRWRVEAWQGKTVHPAQEIEVKVGEATVVRFSSAASPDK